MTMPLPLDGIRILSVEKYGAGPFGSLYLADMGAEVVKLEPPAGAGHPGGDNARRVGPHLIGEGDSQFFQTFNRNKRCLALDLKQPEGQKVLHELVPHFDAVLNNSRGDQPARLGLDFAALGHLKPDLVCTHITAYGREGERADWPGYDYLMQAEAGYFHLTGEPDTPPTRMGLSIIDYMAGVTAAFALTAALLGAARTGKGRDVDVSLYDVAMHQLTYPGTWYLNEGEETGRRPRSGHPSVVPCEMLPTADGWIFVMCVLPKFWLALCGILGLPDLPEDARFAKPQDRLKNRDALMDLLDAASRTNTTAHWLGLMQGRIPVSPVLTVSQALDNPYFRDRGGVRTVDHPAYPGLQTIANPIRVGDMPADSHGPELGADTDAILGEIGIGADRIAQLRKAAVI